MLVKSRVGVGKPMLSTISKPRLGSSPAKVLARPEPKAPSSNTKATVLTCLPVASLMLVRFCSATSVICLKPGAKRNTPYSPRPVI